MEDITGLNDRAARDVLYALIKKRLLVSDTPRGAVRLGFPIDVVERWFPLFISPHEVIHEHEKGTQQRCLNPPFKAGDSRL